MTEHNDQLTWQHVIGMLLLGLCVWAIIIGIIYAVVAEDSYPGFVIAMTGLIGSYAVNRWLIFINEPKE